MTTHTITLARHTAQVVGLMGVLVLGTWDSYGTEQLLLRHGPEWEGLAIDATFHNVPNDEGVTVLADTDGLVTVPPEACMRASKYATITFRGVQDGVQRISCNLPYMVLDHAQVPGANSTATPSEIAQALAQMQDLRDGAVDAKRHAEAARDDAANSAAAAKESETSAGQSATAAKTAQSAAETAKAGAETAQKAAASSASSASTSASTATTQAAAAKSSATTAKESEAAAGKSAKDAAASAANLDSAVNTATQKAAAASASAEAAKASESAAASSEAAARKYANSAELAAKTAGEAAAEKLQQMQAIQGDVTAKQAQTATDATAAKKAKVAAEAAQNGAAASETAAADSAAAAKTSEDAAAKSAADADSTANSINNSMMQIAANKEAVSQLKEDLSNKITKFYASNQGETHLADSDNGKIMDMMVYGKSSQDGTPTPENPVEIKSVVNPTVKVTNEDGLKVQSVTLNNITLNAIPVSSGGNVTIDGQQYIADYVDVEHGKVIRNILKWYLADVVKMAFNNIVWHMNITRLGIDGSKIGLSNMFKVQSQNYANLTISELYIAFDGKSASLNMRGMADEEFKKWLAEKNPEVYNVLTVAEETPITPEETLAFKRLMTYYPVTNISVSSEQLDGYTVFNYPISMANGWNYVKQQLNDNRDYIYDMDLQSAEAYVNSEYAVVLTELEV